MSDGAGMNYMEIFYKGAFTSVVIVSLLIAPVLLSLMALMYLPIFIFTKVLTDEK